MCVHEYMLEYVTLDVIYITWIYKCSIFPIKKKYRSDFLSVFSGVWDDFEEKEKRNTPRWSAKLWLFLLDCCPIFWSQLAELIPRKWIVHYQLFLEEDSVLKNKKEQKEKNCAGYI